MNTTQNLLGLNISRAVYSAITDISDLRPPLDNEGKTNANPDEALVDSMVESNHGLVRCFYHVLKAHNAYILRDTDSALKSINSALELRSNLTGELLVALLNVFHSLILLQSLNARKLGRIEQQEALRAITENRQALAVWTNDCPVNFAHLKLLIEGELLRYEGKGIQAITNYQSAIKLATEGEFQQYVALAHQLAAEVWDSLGHEAYVRYHIHLARNTLPRVGRYQSS